MLSSNYINVLQNSNELNYLQIFYAPRHKICTQMLKSATKALINQIEKETVEIIIRNY